MLLALPLMAILATCIVSPLAAHAQFALPQLADNSTEPQQTKADQLSELELLREENGKALRVAQKTIESNTEKNDQGEEKKPDAVTREVELRTQLGYVLDQIKSTSEREQQLETRVDELTADLNALRTAGPKEEKPYSFLLVEQLRDELATEEMREERIEAVLAEASAARDRAKTLAEEKHSARRKTKEALDTNKVENATGELGAALLSAELEAQVAEETAKLRERELQIETSQQELHALRMKFLQEKLQFVTEDVEFTRHDLQEQKLQLVKQQEDLNRALDWAQRKANELEQRWAVASRKLAEQTEKDPALEEQIESHRMGQQVWSQEVTLLTAQLQRIARAMTIWEQRYDISRDDVKTEEIERWEEEAEQMLEQLEREGRLQIIRLEELRQDLATLDKKLQAQQDAPAEVVEAIQEQRAHLVSQLRTFEANQASIKASRRLHEKLLKELQGDSTQFDLELWRTQLWGHIGDAWHYELTTVDERPITVGKIVSGMILLLLGVFASRWLSKLFAQRFLRRLGMSHNATPAFQAVSFYFLVASFALLALRMVNVPLGVLTFLGGAVAIGLGFGSQNILNNFISGLILLAERPVRVGDLIEIEGQLGRVERIGGRSTRIRDFANLEIIIPNSTFLQTNVVNWSLGNRSIRRKISVGVAYGSSTRDVVRTLRKAADDHGLVLEDPEPMVIFTDFGDSALLFDLHVWLPVQSVMERIRIESDLRLMIDSAFREAKISIPFPQRDLHFDATRPLSVKMHTEDDDSLPKAG